MVSVINDNAINRFLCSESDQHLAAFSVISQKDKKGMIKAGFSGGVGAEFSLVSGPKEKSRLISERTVWKYTPK